MGRGLAQALARRRSEGPAENRRKTVPLNSVGAKCRFAAAVETTAPRWLSQGALELTKKSAVSRGAKRRLDSSLEPAARRPSRARH